MSGPLGRFAAALGLIMMIPIGYQVETGGLGMRDAAIRAAVTLLAVVAVRKLAGLGIGAMADSMDRLAETTPRRRATDH